MRALRTNIILGVLLCWELGAADTFRQAKSWKEIQAPPLRAFAPQLPMRLELSNGMVVFLQEDHELPMIRGLAWIRGGSRDEAPGKAGLVEILGQAWRTGGTKTRNGDDLDDFLEARAAKVESSGGRDYTTLTWDCLKENFDEVFAIYLELMREPAFREDKIGLARKNMETSIARRNDDASQIADRESTRLVYGVDSPYGRIPEYATVAAVSRSDLLAFHHANVVPNNVVLGIVGDFDARQMEERVRTAFERWPKGTRIGKRNDKFNGPAPGIYFVPKDDVNASQVHLVDLGITIDNPDYFALEVFNHFFGGSMRSRLFSNVRSRKGLAYAVDGGVGANPDFPGVLRLRLVTKSGSTSAAIEAFHEEIDALKSRPASGQEIDAAKAAILNSMVFRLDSKQKVMEESMGYELFGYPLDFLQRYRAAIEKVSEADVARVAEKYLHKDKLAILVVGKAADFDRPLSSFGEVKNIDTKIP